MKLFYLIIIILIAFSPICSSQIDIPMFSEPGFITQRVGNTNFKISYERPKANGRVIFGDLVPYGKVWRTGAGPCTKITFDKPVFINSKEIPSGTYSLFTVPNEAEWTIILNSDTTLYGAYDYDSSKDLVRLKADRISSPIWTETFNINMDVRNDVAIVRLSWKESVISFNIETRTYDNLLVEAKDILENTYPLEEGTYTVCAEYIIHNKIGFADDYLLIAEKLVDKALAQKVVSSYTFHKKREILKLQNNREEYVRYSKLHIEFLEKNKPYKGYEESVIIIKKEVADWK